MKICISKWLTPEPEPRWILMLRILLALFTIGLGATLGGFLRAGILLNPGGNLVLTVLLCSSAVIFSLAIRWVLEMIKNARRGLG